MGQQHRLGVLQVGAPGHDRPQMRLRLSFEGLCQIEYRRDDAPRLIAQKRLEQGGDLIVAGPAGAQAPADIGADLGEEQPLERAVNILVASGPAAASPRRTAPRAP